MPTAFLIFFDRVENGFSDVGQIRKNSFPAGGDWCVSRTFGVEEILACACDVFGKEFDSVALGMAVIAEPVDHGVGFIAFDKVEGGAVVGGPKRAKESRGENLTVSGEFSEE